MKKPLVILAALLVALPAGAFNFRLRIHGQAPAICVYGASLGDGCPSAPTSSAYTVQHSDFFTSYALQNGHSYQSASFTGSVSGGVLTTSGVTGAVEVGNTLMGTGVPAGTIIASGSGSTWTLNVGGAATSLTINNVSMTTLRRPTWNVAGVDYPVGIPASEVALGLQDPATAQTAPTCTAGTHGCMPQGCSYASNNIFCSSTANPTFNGFDLSLHNGMTIEIAATVTGQVTIKNSYFFNGSYMTGGLQNYWIECDPSGGTASFLIQNNYVDGNSRNFSIYPDKFIGTFCSGAVTSKYNAYIHVPRLIASVSGGGLVQTNDYIEGLNYNTGNHGDEDFVFPNNTSGTTSLMQWSYVTAFNTDTNGMTTMFWVNGGGASSGTVTTAQADHNIAIAWEGSFTGHIDNGAGGAGVVLTVESIAASAGLPGTTLNGGAQKLHGSAVSAGTQVLYQITATGSPWYTATGSITNGVLTTTQGNLYGMLVVGAGVPTGTQVITNTSGNNWSLSTNGSTNTTLTVGSESLQFYFGGPGTYAVNNSQLVAPGSNIIYDTTSVALLRVGHLSIGALSVTYNWVDARGALTCFGADNDGSTLPAPTMTGNLNLTDGSSLDGASVTGGALTFTADPCHNHGS